MRKKADGKFRWVGRGKNFWPTISVGDEKKKKYWIIEGLSSNHVDILKSWKSLSNIIS